MSEQVDTSLEYEAKPPGPASTRADDIAYIAPMAAFLAGTWAGANWPALYPLFYVLKASATAILLIFFWRRYTPIRWNFWWLGLVLGVVGIVQWIGMQLWLQNHFPLFHPNPDAFNPFTYFKSGSTRWGFIGVRLISAVLIVPVMEELFWRDYLWRQILAPNDFKLAEVGEWGWAPFLIVSGLFATVHGNCWLTAIVWGLMIATLLVRTKSLGACIIMHGTTNLLLALYVLHFQDWAFW